MASGSFHKYPISGKEFGLYCTWSATSDKESNIAGNYSDVIFKIYARFYTLDMGSRSGSTAKIHDSTETYTAPAIHDLSSTSYHNVLLKTKTLQVKHSDDGTKSCVLAATWPCNVNYSGTQVSSITANDTVTFDKIDRGVLKVRDSNWKQGLVWVKASGSWKRAKGVFVKVNGTWKRSK